MDDVAEIMDGLMTELKRGTAVLCVLSVLKERQYGYTLSQLLFEKGFPVDQNTLYPLLRRLESQQLLGSEWVLDDSRPRKYYELSEKGRAVLRRLTDEWENMTRNMLNLLI
jgi:PadR family transcriptional regulator, regulatory protein PadR